MQAKAGRTVPHREPPASVRTPPASEVVRHEEAPPLGNLFQGCIKGPVAIPLDVSTALSEEQYKVNQCFSLRWQCEGWKTEKEAIANVTRIA